MRRRALVPALLAVLALVTGACSGAKPAAAPPPPPVTEESTTTAPTTSTTAKPVPTTTGVPRTTTTASAALGPGSATLTGTVSGPQGPVDGATVRVERLVGKTVATADVSTSAGGSWAMPSILGGAYRVRAFKPPDLGQSQVEAFFLAANERKVIDFKLPAASGDRIIAVINPSPPRVDQPATLTITLGVGRVDDQGRPALIPKAGVLLSVATGPGQVLESSPQSVTDASGAASFRIRCVAEGPSQVALTVGGGVTQVNLPACAAPAPAGGTPTTKSG